MTENVRERLIEVLRTITPRLHEPAPEPGIRGRVLRILADHDYNDGGMMRWHPSGEPTEQAERVADRIMREAFNSRDGVR